MGLPKSLLQLNELPTILPGVPRVSYLYPSTWSTLFSSFSWHSLSRLFNIQLKFHLSCEAFSDVLKTINQFFSKTAALSTTYHTTLYYLDYMCVRIPSLSSLKAGTVSFPLQKSALGQDTWLSREMNHAFCFSLISYCT